MGGTEALHSDKVWIARAALASLTEKSASEEILAGPRPTNDNSAKWIKKKGGI